MSEEVAIPRTHLGVNALGPLELPRSLAERHELFNEWSLAESQVERNRVMGAALALTWPLLRADLAAHKITYRGDVVEYGRQAIDRLLADESPPTYHDICHEGLLRLQAVIADLFKVVGAANDPSGFSTAGPSAGSSESSSQSNGTTISQPEPLATSTSIGSPS